MWRPAFGAWWLPDKTPNCAAPEDLRSKIKEHVDRARPTLLLLGNEARELAAEFVGAKIVPARREADAIHVACAIVHGLELLVSWNYRHIANERKAEGFNRVARLCKFSGNLTIVSPVEVLKWKK